MGNVCYRHPDDMAQDIVRGSNGTFPTYDFANPDRSGRVWEEELIRFSAGWRLYGFDNQLYKMKHRSYDTDRNILYRYDADRRLWSFFGKLSCHVYDLRFIKLSESENAIICICAGYDLWAAVLSPGTRRCNFTRLPRIPQLPILTSSYQIRFNRESRELEGFFAIKSRRELEFNYIYGKWQRFLSLKKKHCLPVLLDKKKSISLAASLVCGVLFGTLFLAIFSDSDHDSYYSSDTYSAYHYSRRETKILVAPAETELKGELQIQENASEMMKPRLLSVDEVNRRVICLGDNGIFESFDGIHWQLLTSAICFDHSCVTLFCSNGEVTVQKEVMYSRSSKLLISRSSSSRLVPPLANSFANLLKDLPKSAVAVERPETVGINAYMSGSHFIEIACVGKMMHGMVSIFGQLYKLTTSWLKRTNGGHNNEWTYSSKNAIRLPGEPISWSGGVYERHVQTLATPNSREVFILTQQDPVLSTHARGPNVVSIHVSRDEMKTFELISQSFIPSTYGSLSLAIVSSDLFVIAGKSYFETEHFNGSFPVRWFHEMPPLVDFWASTDRGKTWSLAQSGCSLFHFKSHLLPFKGGLLVVGYQNNFTTEVVTATIWRATDSGLTCTRLTSLQDVRHRIMVDEFFGRLICPSGDGLYYSFDGEKWVKTLSEDYQLTWGKEGLQRARGRDNGCMYVHNGEIVQSPVVRDRFRWSVSKPDSNMANRHKDLVRLVMDFKAVPRDITEHHLFPFIFPAL